MGRMGVLCRLLWLLLLAYSSVTFPAAVAQFDEYVDAIDAIQDCDTDDREECSVETCGRIVRNDLEKCPKTCGKCWDCTRDDNPYLCTDLRRHMCDGVWFVRQQCPHLCQLC